MRYISSGMWSCCLQVQLQVCGGTVVGTSISATYFTNSGIVSAGRDLADIFATSSGNVEWFW